MVEPSIWSGLIEQIPYAVAIMLYTLYLTDRLTKPLSVLARRIELLTNILLRDMTGDNVREYLKENERITDHGNKA